MRNIPSQEKKLALKGELIGRFDSCLRAAPALGLSQTKLSLIINGHYSPTKAERRAFERVLGVERAEKLLG
jgi:hypothetical protein